MTTAFPRQRHYALDPAETARHPPSDVTAERIGGQLDYDMADLCRATPGGG